MATRWELQQRRGLPIEHVDLMLREVADDETTTRRQRTADAVQRAGDGLDDSRLALTVGAEQTDALTRCDAQIDIRDDDARRLLVVAGIAAVHVLDDQHRIGRRRRRAEAERERRRVDDRRDQRHAFHRLDAALRLSCLGCLGLEAIDEVLQVGRSRAAACRRRCRRASAARPAEFHRPCMLPDQRTSFWCSSASVTPHTASRNSRSCEMTISVPA